METRQILHPYRYLGRGGWFPPTPWSPDGKWLAFVAEAENPDEAGLWIIAADGSQEIYLGGTNPLWSPDGRYLARRTAEGARLVEVASWYELDLYLPAEALIVNWQ